MAEKIKHPIYKIPLKTISHTYDVAGKILIGIAIATIASLAVGGCLVALVDALSDIAARGM